MPVPHDNGKSAIARMKLRYSVRRKPLWEGFQGRVHEQGVDYGKRASSAAERFEAVRPNKQYAKCMLFVRPVGTSER